MKQKPYSGILTDRKGAMATIIALSTPIFLGGVALAVDTAQWTLAHRLMQRQADSAALAGVFAIAQRADHTASATRDLALNPGFPFDVPPVIQRGPTTGPSAGDNNAVRVALSTTMRLPFASLFLPDGARITAEATATLINTGDVCVLALENSDNTGIIMTGSSIVDLNCAMVTNSVSASAITATGATRVIASPMIASGGIPPSSNYSPGTVLLPYSIAQPDPYGYLGNPVIPSGSKKMEVNPNNSASFTPGRYTKVDIKGTANLAPGTYYIDATDFSVNSQATLNGTGVTIVLTSSSAAGNPGSVSTTKMNGGATINLSAPTSGEYKGVLFYRDRRATNTTSVLNGNSSSVMRGAVYFPSSTLEFTGNTGMNIDCIQLVTWRLVFSGNSEIRNICPANSGSNAVAGYVVRLVG